MASSRLRDGRRTHPRPPDRPTEGRPTAWTRGGLAPPGAASHARALLVAVWPVLVAASAVGCPFVAAVESAVAAAQAGRRRQRRRRTTTILLLRSFLLPCPVCSYPLSIPLVGTPQTTLAATACPPPAALTPPHPPTTDPSTGARASQPASSQGGPHSDLLRFVPACCSRAPFLPRATPPRQTTLPTGRR